MATKTKRRRAFTRYELCCMSIMLISHPAAPYRVYVADGRDGKVVGRREVKSFETETEAERWLRRHCRHWTLCDAT
jgi:hypothetical protein